MFVSNEIAAQLLRIAATALQDLFLTTPEQRAGLADIDEGYHGVFVTLYNGDELRGCIGYLAKLKPLGEAIYELAQSSATADRRFTPIQHEELGCVSIDITLLGPMEPIQSPEEIEVGVHGVFIEHGKKRGILLPQVAIERGWTRERFADAVCEKAALQAGIWRKPGCRFQRFTACIISSEQQTQIGT